MSDGIPRVVYQISPPRRRPHHQHHHHEQQARPHHNHEQVRDRASSRPRQQPTSKSSPATPSKAASPSPSRGQNEMREKHLAPRSPGVLSPRDENLRNVRHRIGGITLGAPPQAQSAQSSGPMSPLPMSPMQDGRRMKSPSKITAADLLNDPDSFQDMASALISRHAVEQFVSPKEILLSTLTVEQREAFAKALTVKFEDLSTFPEAGEQPSCTLVRDAHRVFGRALQNLLTSAMLEGGAGGDHRWSDGASDARYGDENSNHHRPRQELPSPHYERISPARFAYPENGSFGNNYHHQRSEQPHYGPTSPTGTVHPDYGPSSPTGTVHPDGPTSPTGTVHPDDPLGYRRMEHFERDPRSNYSNGTEKYTPPTETIQGNHHGTRKYTPPTETIQGNHQQPATAEQQIGDSSHGSTNYRHGGVEFDERHQYQESRYTRENGHGEPDENVSSDQSVPSAQAPERRDEIQRTPASDTGTLQSAMRSNKLSKIVTSFEESYETEAARRQRIFEEMEHTARILKGTPNDEVRTSHMRHLKDLQQEWEQLKESASPTSTKVESVGRSSKFTSRRNVAKKLWKGEQIMLRPPDGDDKSVRSAKSTLSTATKSVFDDEKSTASGPATRPMGKRCTVNVVAPETLPANFTFEARLGDHVFMATVPDGGVAKGDIFPSSINDINSDADRASVRVRTLLDMGAPTTRWRDELFDCCSDGMGHPLLCNSIFCPQVALSQIMARLQLTSRGERGITLNSRMRVKQVFWLSFGLFFVHFIYFIPVYMRARQNVSLYLISFVPLMVMDAGLLCYFWFLLIKTRKAMREEYDIPQIHCRCLGCEDAYTAIFFPCCTISQMGRHSADYTTYRGMCCTDTGLPNHVEVKLPSDPLNAELV